MALADIILNDGKATPESHTFTFLSIQNGRVVRADLAMPAETPLTMTIAHQNSGSGQSAKTSHLVRFDWTLLDADGVTPCPNNIRVMADISKRVSSDALIDDLTALVRNALTQAFGRAWVKGSNG